MSEIDTLVETIADAIEAPFLPHGYELKRHLLKSAARNAIEASGLTTLSQHNAKLVEALTDIRNRILCPVGPSPTLELIAEIARQALNEGVQP